jgi:type II secretory pathway pseudopilin PulG
LDRRLDFASWSNQTVGMESHGVGRLGDKFMKHKSSGISLIEVMMATAIMIIASISILGLVSASIATNSRNKVDSTGAMLAQSVIEQIKATIIGSGSSSLTDCAGIEHTINTAPGGANLSGSSIDFTQTGLASDYKMDYVVKSPCDSTGIQATTYDVRWRVEIVGAAAGTPTNTYLITVGSRMQGHSEGNMFFSLPVNFRILVGN